MSMLYIQVKAIFERLSPGGWDRVFAQHGLDTTSVDLKAELIRKLNKINRNAPGFEDFSTNGRRGIQQGCPSESLVYHALASPNVVSYFDENRVEKKISIFPTPNEIETIENFVYGLIPPTIDELRVVANNAPLAIVVFAKEYRPAINTVHRQHADFCYSRTGVSRVGTSPSKYLEEARGYLPYNDESPNKIRVMPCRYGAYIAALVPGRKDSHGPMRYITPDSLAQDSNFAEDKVAGRTGSHRDVVGHEKSDDARRFWVPLHKLFSGDECIFGKNIEVNYAAKHLNEKLRRIHLMFGRIGHNGGWHEPDISKPPFAFTDGIAELSLDPSDGLGLIVPEQKKALVAIAKYKKKTLTYNVPNAEKYDSAFVYRSTLGIRNPNDNGARRAPEYVHARYAIDFEGMKEQDLNELENVRQIISLGNYKAKHVLDFTADGYVDVACPELNMEIPHRLPAFSLVAPPDFYSGLKQRDLMQWWEQSVPTSLKESIWPTTPGAPQALSDQRIAANQNLPDINFDENDDSITSIVGPHRHHHSTPARILPPKNRRGSTLPDGAAGVFAPGWDVSFDQKFAQIDEEEDVAEDPSIITFFSSYGLGSPFPEDAKLCAALSSFWPAAAPDITRTFSPSNYATTTPLLDRAIGLEDLPPWDGVLGPRVINPRKKIIEYVNIDYSDYVSTSLRNGFDLSSLSSMTPQEYLARTVAMARVYQALGAKTTNEKTKFAVLSFKYADVSQDFEFKKALEESGAILNNEYAFRFQIYEPLEHIKNKKQPFDKVWVGYKKIQTIYGDPLTVLMKNDDNKWIKEQFRD